MIIQFYKYHGTGNDFVIIENLKGEISLNKKQISFICSRRFGVGADGLMLLNSSKEADFKMEYYNSDGSGATMCGNGARCIVAFAAYIGLLKKRNITFIASDGLHHAKLINKNRIKIKMSDVDSIENVNSDFFCDTGSPHYVKFQQDLNTHDVYSNGKEIRNSTRYKETGTNVNFIEEISENKIFVRTYERGVEDETNSCGTGAVASAIILSHIRNSDTNIVKIKTKGGKLKVFFKKEDNFYKDIWLEGPVSNVFEGIIEI